MAFRKRPRKGEPFWQNKRLSTSCFQVQTQHPTSSLSFPLKYEHAGAIDKTDAKISTPPNSPSIFRKEDLLIATPIDLETVRSVLSNNPGGK